MRFQEEFRPFLTDLTDFIKTGFTGKFHGQKLGDGIAKLLNLRP